VIDIFELARTGGTVVGQLPLSAERLRASLRLASGALDFCLHGRVDELGRPSARLSIRGELPLTCDRCGGPLDLRVEQENTFYFVREESELAGLPVSADAESEPLLGSDRFDVAALVEDETILCIPVSPRHEVCLAPTDGAVSRRTSQVQNPFAALPGLLRDKQ